MKIKVIKTRILVPPRDDLLGVIKNSLKRIPERSILVVTSKVVSIWEGRSIPKDRFPDKDEIIKKEADKYLPKRFVPGKWIMHTMKHDLFIPSAGVDESNANGFYLLWPTHPERTAEILHRWIRKTYRVKNCGVIITDSHTIPLRRGTIGISLAHCGFNPLRNYRGTKEIFGRKFTMTQTNIADGLAAAAVVVMGEGRERTPLALITDIRGIRFTGSARRSQKLRSLLKIPEKEDLYYPFLSCPPWKKGGGGVRMKKYMLRKRNSNE